MTWTLFNLEQAWPLTMESCLSDVLDKICLNHLPIWCSLGVFLSTEERIFSWASVSWSLTVCRRERGKFSLSIPLSLSNTILIFPYWLPSPSSDTYTARATGKGLVYTGQPPCSCVIALSLFTLYVSHRTSSWGGWEGWMGGGGGGRGRVYSLLWPILARKGYLFFRFRSEQGRDFTSWSA